MLDDDFINKYLFGGNISDKKVRYIAAGIVLCAYVIATSVHDQNKNIMLISSMVLSFIIGLIGRKRKIGFGKAYVASLFLAPVVLCISAAVFGVM